VGQKADLRPLSDLELGDDLLQALGGDHAKAQMHRIFDHRIGCDDDAGADAALHFLRLDVHALDEIDRQHLVAADNSTGHSGRLQDIGPAARSFIRLQDGLELAGPRRIALLEH